MCQVKVDDFEPNIRLPSVVRSQSAQGLASRVSSPILKIPLPPRSWFTDVSNNESSEEDAGDERENDMKILERNKMRARYRHPTRAFATVPIGIFWDIENCQVPRGCSAIDVVSAIRAKFLAGRRESDFVVVCDVRKETAHRLQELNDAQVSLIHVCGTQKNAADEKLRQCMRRFGEIHSAPAALLLISGDINFASDLSDFRHRKGLEVILVHKQNTSNALIACASSHYCYNELTSQLPRNFSKVSSNEGDDEPACMVEVLNLPTEQQPTRVARRLKRLADNCGGRVFHIAATVAIMKFPTPDHAARAAKRMDSEDVFGHKIVTRYSPNGCQSSVQGYSSDEGYSTGSVANGAREREGIINQQQVSLGSIPVQPSAAQQEWALALQQLPAPTPPPLDFCPPPAPKPRRIRGTHGSNMNQSGCSSSNSGNGDRETSHSRAVSPWNSSASYSSEGDAESSTEVSVSNLPSLDLPTLHDMLKELFSQHVPVVSVTVWMATEGPLATVVLRSEWDARLAIARIHKRRFDNKWAHSGKRLELSFGKPSPIPNVDMLRARLRAILLDQPYYTMPLLRLRDAYANRHCSALTTADISRVKDTVVILEGVGRYVKLIDFTPVSVKEMEEAPWKCHIHATLNSCPEDGSRVLQPVFVELSVLATNTLTLLGNHGGIVPLLSFVECYETFFPALPRDVANGVPLELLLRSVNEVEVRESPSRHVTWRAGPNAVPAPAPRTAPSLEPMLALLERELSDLLRSSPRCTIAFSKLIPAFHHHFGRQCRVADYGFTKLPDLLAALSNAIVVLGSGSSRLITLSAASQSRRWTSDMLKMLKAQPGRVIHPKEIPQLYQTTFNTAFSPADYGVCLLEELMMKLNMQTLTRSPDGSVSLPRRAPTPEERARTAQFAAQAVELLCTTPNLRMEFSKFVPAYHAHFGRQLRVAHYGCVKLAELFELIPEAVTVTSSEGGERLVKLSSGPALAVMNQRMERLAPVPLSHLPVAYAAQYGGSLDGLVEASGGGVGVKHAQPEAHCAVAVSSALAACAVLSADRSVARGSTEDYFANSYRRKCGVDPDLRRLVAAGVVTCIDRRVRVTSVWRAVWRIAQIVSDASEPITALQMLMEYTKRYEPTFPSSELGFASLYDLVRSFPSVFVEEAGVGGGAAGTRWRMASGVLVPRQTHLTPQLNYSIHDTPPGQKGSRVFESPKNRVWCSPPASAVPMPSALLPHDNKRRIRLAAQFDGI